MAFTPYVALTAFVPLAAAIAVRNWAAAIAATLVAVLLAGAVLPREFGGPTEAAGVAGPPLRVLAANMRLGEGDVEALVSLVREHRVDLLSVEELTPKLARRLDAAGLRRLLPHRELATDRSSRGSGLLSRFELGPGSVGPLNGGFPLITKLVAVPGAPPLAASAVHTVPPTASTAAWSADLGALPPAGEGPLRILLGDFNATLDHSEFRDLVARGYADAAATLGRGLEPTWPDHRRFPAATDDRPRARRQPDRDPRLRGRGAPRQRPPGRLCRALATGSVAARSTTRFSRRRSRVTQTPLSRRGRLSRGGIPRTERSIPSPPSPGSGPVAQQRIAAHRRELIGLELGHLRRAVAQHRQPLAGRGHGEQLELVEAGAEPALGSPPIGIAGEQQAVGAALAELERARAAVGEARPDRAARRPPGRSRSGRRSRAAARRAGGRNAGRGLGRMKRTRSGRGASTSGSPSSRRPGRQRRASGRRWRARPRR